MILAISPWWRGNGEKVDTGISKKIEHNLWSTLDGKERKNYDSHVV
jgi:hypothetical protein